MKKSELFREIEMLPAQQRMLLAEYILESLNATDSNIKASWKDEVQRRMDTVDKGLCEVIPSEDFHSVFYGIIKSKQK